MSYKTKTEEVTYRLWKGLTHYSFQRLLKTDIFWHLSSIQLYVHILPRCIGSSNYFLKCECMLTFSYRVFSPYSSFKLFSMTIYLCYVRFILLLITLGFSCCFAQNMKNNKVQFDHFKQLKNVLYQNPVKMNTALLI